MPSAGPIANVIKRSILTMKCTVWARTANTGPYNVAVRTDLACFILPVNMQPAATSANRADLASLRVWMYDVAYSLPTQGVQIEITSHAEYAGQKWNIQRGTERPHIPVGYDGAIAIEVDVRRAS